MLWDLCVLSMPLRILKHKLLLYHHLASLPKTAIAHQILLTQEKYNFPSLRDGIKSFLEEFQIFDVTQYSKKKWKYFVERHINELNRRFLLKEMEKYKKVDSLSLSLEEYKTKDYFKTMSLESSRMFFRYRSQTVTSCRMHYRNMEENIKGVYSCISCQNRGEYFQIDQISHWFVCSSYSHLKPMENVYESDEALSEFLIKVVQYRKEYE